MSERGDNHKMMVRIPMDLFEILKDISEREERSMNAQIVWCLRRCLDGNTGEDEAKGAGASP